MEKLKGTLIAHTKKNKKTNTLYKPVFIKPVNSVNLKKIRNLLKLPGIQVSDTILDQLRELIKTLHPQKKITAKEITAAIATHLGKTKPEAYGVWVYYPWSNRLVHLLDKNEFIRVRTSRNHYKITPQEQALLANKKIGVIGLSVGQSVSVTLAMERICGELRLADFDVLELTNLNRIRTGVHNLNLPKVYSVAREIAEIDPFIKIKCFPKGLTEKNMNSFFTRGGKLDLLVEESDGFDIKILCRYKARELKIPVIMEASDRCMVDVERFDLEPKRSILHGRLDHLDINTLKSLKTTEEKIPYMLDILGIETASLRLKASMLEIEQSINTWPQLASAVTMGGGITADVSRRILLSEFNDSGRYYVDVEELIGNKTGKTTLDANDTNQLNVTDGFDFKTAALGTRINSQPDQVFLDKNTIQRIVASGCQAPSGGNTQPWRWVYKNGALLLFNPFEPNASLLDYESLASFIAIGAALENIQLHAEHLNLKAHFTYFPEADNTRLVAIIKFTPNGLKTKYSAARFKAINQRLTNRQITVREKISDEVLNKMIAAAKETTGASLHFITDNKQLDLAGDVLGEIEKLRFLEKQGHKDFVNEIRWTVEENERFRDGIDLRTVDLTNAEIAGFRIAKSPEVITKINEWKGGGAFKRLTKKSIDASGAIGVLSIHGDTKEHYINAGRALERVWIEANMNRISFQPVSACLFMYARLLKGKGLGLSNHTCAELKRLRPQFEKALNISNRMQEMFIFRLSKSGTPEIKSLRKPLDELFCYLENLE